MLRSGQGLCFVATTIWLAAGPRASSAEERAVSALVESVEKRYENQQPLAAYIQADALRTQVAWEVIRQAIKEIGQHVALKKAGQWFKLKAYARIKLVDRALAIRLLEEYDAGYPKYN